MKILVTLATDNRLAGKTFLAKSTQILDGAFLPKGLQDKVTLLAQVYDPRSNPDQSLAEFLLETSEEADAMAVMVDVPLAGQARDLHPSMFIGRVDFTAYLLNVQNVLSGQASRLLRNLAFLLLDTEDATRFQAAVLPLRNFDAPELRALSALCRDGALGGDFGGQAKTLINGLVARRGPKRRSDYPHRYFRDDVRHSFRYGHEEHSRFETGGDHGITCHLNGLFRFGRRLEDQRHFNVTDGEGDDDCISADFLNCHDDPVTIVERSHVNMFCNDFHK